MLKAWDADGHVMESEATYQEPYWDTESLHRRPYVVESDHSGTLSWVIDSRLFPVRTGPYQSAGTPLSKDGIPWRAPNSELMAERREYDTVESAEFRSAAIRLEQLDRENIDVQINYPTMFLSYPITYDPALGTALTRSYNNWVADISSQAPDRFKWVTAIDPQDPKAAANEVYRTAEMGSVGVMILGMTGDFRIDDPEFEGVWAAAAETNLSVGVHVGHSFRALGEVCDTHHDKTVLPFWLTLLFGFQRVIAKGIADKYPNLRIAFLEGGCSWVPGLVDRIAEHCGLPGSRSGPSFRKGYLAQHYPQEYIQRGQVYFGFEVEEGILPYVLEEFGDECWLYASDIPHRDRLYGSVGLFQERTDISEETKRKLLVDNTARFYGLDLATKQPLAQGAGSGGAGG